MARFQTFDDPADGAHSAARIAKLRDELARRGLDGFVVPRADEHQSEYVPANAERLPWLTGFTGSAGTAIVLADKAALVVDGRYTLQAAEQVDTAVVDVVPLADKTAEAWIGENLAAGATLAYDPWLHTAGGLKKLEKAVAQAGAALAAVEINLVDVIWLERPPPPKAPVRPHPAELAGETSEAKLARIREAAREGEARRARGLGPAQPRLDLQHPRRRRRAYAAAARLCGDPGGWAPDGVPRSGEGHERGRRRHRRRRRHRAAGDAAGRARSARIGESEGADRRRERRRRARPPHRERRRGGRCRARPDLAYEGGEERRRDRRHARGAPARRRRGDALPRLARARGAVRQAHRDRGGREARGPARRDRPSEGARLLDHLGLGAERRDRALPRHEPDQPRAEARRAVPPRFRRAIRGRHHRHHPHGRGRRAVARDARPLHARAEGPHRHRPGGVPERHVGSADRRASPARRCGRPGSISTTAPATASAAICPSTRGRSGCRSSARRRSSRA